MQFHTVVTSHYLECVCRSIHQYNKALKKVSNLVVPGGNLIMVGSLNAQYKTIGERKIGTVVKLNATDVRYALESAGFSVVKFDDFEICDANQQKKKIFVVVAKKKENGN